MDKTHLQLLCDVNELSAIVAGSEDIGPFLRRIADLVAGHMTSPVCSIYLYQESNDELFLRVTKGLTDGKLPDIHMKSGEGLTGLCMAQLKPVMVEHASKHPNFKAFDSLRENEFEAYLAVPIHRGNERIGVLVVQRSEDEPYQERDLLALQATASQLASVIENARVMISLKEREPVRKKERQSFLKSQVVCGGFAHNPSLRLENLSQNWLEVPFDLERDDYSLADFEACLKTSIEQLSFLEKRLKNTLPEMATMIFSAHLMIMKDPEYSGSMRELIEKGETVPEAIRQVANRYIEIFEHSKNAYVREKIADILDLTKRLMGNLTGTAYGPGTNTTNRIVIAHDLYPSEIVKLASSDTAGVILMSGGVNSHASILARSLRLPTVICGAPELAELEDGSDLLLDAEIGNIYIDPPADIVSHFEERNQHREVVGETTLEPETYTACGKRIKLLANINLLSDLNTAKQLQVEGVGLYRTEFPFLIRSDFPSEAEQASIYENLINAMTDKPVTMRTLDIGGDKILSYFYDPTEDNPNLGMRSIRFSLQYPDIFKEQIKAMLIAGVDHKQLRILFPMIAGLEEFEAAKAVLDASMAELKEEKIAFNDTIELGVMIEIPSIVNVIDEIAEQVDFFCVGTNDFIQFILAVDRNNEKVANYYIPQHPAVLRSLAQVIKAANKAGKDLSICGEMAHEAIFIPFFIGLGVPCLSVDSQFLPALQKQVQSLNVEDCREFAESLLAMSRVSDIEAYISKSPLTESLASS